MSYTEKKNIKHIEDEVEMTTVCKALSSPQRMMIMQAISRKSMTVSELANLLKLAQSTMTVHIQELEAAGLLRAVVKPGPVRGQRKLCSAALDGISFVFASEKDENSISMPVGHFVDFAIKPTCGMNSTTGILVKVDTPAAFTTPQRADAQVVWGGEDSYFEYRFQVLPCALEAKGMEISAELCSEFLDSKIDWKSDISLWIDSELIGTFNSPGDMGGRRGRFTPSWVPIDWSQYGFLVKWRIDEKGCFVNDKLVKKSLTYKKLDLNNKTDIRVRIGIDPKAKNKGGLNLFGRHYGDYEQDIVLKWLM